MSKQLVPHYETHVQYLFARFHHLLGFEKILEFQDCFPDVIALRNNTVTSIELESKLTHVTVHYLVAKAHHNLGEWFEHRNGIWHLYAKPRFNSNLGKPMTLNRFPDEGGNLYKKKYFAVEELRRKSLKPVIDVVVCWEINYAKELRKKILAKGVWHKDQGIEVIELKSKLEELNVDW